MYLPEPKSSWVKPALLLGFLGSSKTAVDFMGCEKLLKFVKMTQAEDIHVSVWWKVPTDSGESGTKSK